MLALAIMSPLTVLGYLLVIDWVDLAPLNMLPVRWTWQQRLKERISTYVPLVIIAFCFFPEHYLPAFLGAFGALVCLAQHIEAWWQPYLFGATPDRHKQYEISVANMTRFLPPIGSNPVPAAAHTIEGGLLLIMAASTFAAAMSLLPA